MKNTFVTTVFNEEYSMDKFLDSIKNQSKKFDEIIVVDGGSNDNTVEIVEQFCKKNKSLNIKVVKKKGNIASGRNEAISLASNELILCADAGCEIDKYWAMNLLSVLNEKYIDVAAGFYKPVAKTTFEKCLSTYTSVMEDKIDEDNFLPSSRSIGFKKEAWKKVGGYPQWLDTCEDLFFAREMKRKGLRFKFVKNAVVFWPQRKNLHQAFVQFFNYAKGDGTARYIRSNTSFLFFRYVIGLLLVIVLLSTNSVALLIFILLLLVFYIIWAIIKNYKYINDYKALVYLPVLQFISDLAVLTGTSYGLVTGIGIKKN